MIEALIVILIIGLILYVIYWVVGQFIQGTPLKIVGAILALIFILVALQRTGILSGDLGLRGHGHIGWQSKTQGLT